MDDMTKIIKFPGQSMDDKTDDQVMNRLMDILNSLDDDDDTRRTEIHEIDGGDKISSHMASITSLDKYRK